MPRSFEGFCLARDHDYCGVDKDARVVADGYKLASGDEQAEIAYLIGDYKPTDRPSDTI